jgi:hypothetical protein
MDYLTIKDVLRAIKPTRVSAAKVRALRNESRHTSLAFALTRESALWAAHLSHVIPGRAGAWDVEQAVLFGQYVRLTKLIRAFLEDTKRHRAEIAWISSRLAVECAINARYLLKHCSPALIESYLHQSLQHEAELRRNIEANIRARAGNCLPIEERMLRSIDRTLTNSGVSETALPKKRIKNWGNKSFFERLQDLGLEHAYNAIFGAPSRNVHGNWQDLLQHHLEVVSPCRFLPRAESTRVRPQLLHVVSQLAVEALQDLVVYVGTSDSGPALRRLSSLHKRIKRAEQLHEDYLSRRKPTA